VDDDDNGNNSTESLDSSGSGYQYPVDIRPPIEEVAPSVIYHQGGSQGFTGALLYVEFSVDNYANNGTTQISPLAYQSPPFAITLRHPIYKQVSVVYLWLTQPSVY